MLRTIGCAINQTLYEIAHADDPDFLRGHPGVSRTILGLPSASNAEAIAEFDKGSPLCESPIERDMLAALVVSNWEPFVALPPRVWNAASKGDARPASDVIIIPQFRVGRHRLDFGISIPKHPIGALIAVECDGAEFHDSEADRERDMQMGRFGILTARFTGREIHADPMGCAERVVRLAIEWAVP